MKLAVIPARGGSKRIPRKNIRDFCGRPMLAWSVAAARDSGCFDAIIVSTDDAEIAEVAQEAGAEAPFLRPPELSDDHTGTLPVIRHAIEAMTAAGHLPTQVCCIYATAPFLTAEVLREGLRILEADDTLDYAFSVTSYAFPIQRAIRRRTDGRVEMFDPAMFNRRSQDLEEAWHDAGQFYWGRAEAWISERLIFGPRSAAVVLSRHRVQDIDNPEDWIRAELMFRAQQVKDGEVSP